MLVFGFGTALAAVAGVIAGPVLVTQSNMAGLLGPIGNLGPAVAPSLTGYITAATGSSLYGTYLIVGAYIFSGLLLVTMVKTADPNDDKS